MQTNITNFILVDYDSFNTLTETKFQIIVGKVFYEALDECARDQGSLASAHSEKENSILQGKTVFSSILYLLLDFASAHNIHRDQFNTVDSCWIGMHDSNRNNSWEWTDLSVVDYTNWIEKKPLNSSIYKCAGIILEHNDTKLIGKWENFECSTRWGHVNKVRCGICKRASNINLDHKKYVVRNRKDDIHGKSLLAAIKGYAYNSTPSSHCTELTNSFFRDMVLEFN